MRRRHSGLLRTVIIGLCGLVLAGCAGQRDVPPTIHVATEAVPTEPEAAFLARLLNDTVNEFDTARGRAFTEQERAAHIAEHRKLARLWLDDDLVATPRRFDGEFTKGDVFSRNDQVAWLTNRLRTLEHAPHWHVDGAPDGVEAFVHRYWRPAGPHSRYLRTTVLDVRIPVESAAHAREQHERIARLVMESLGDGDGWVRRHGEAQRARYQANMRTAQAHREWLAGLEDELRGGSLQPADLDFMPPTQLRLIEGFDYYRTPIDERAQDEHLRRLTRLAEAPETALSDFWHRWGCSAWLARCNTLDIEILNEALPVEYKHGYAWGAFETLPQQPMVRLRIELSMIDRERDREAMCPACGHEDLRPQSPDRSYFYISSQARRAKEARATAAELIADAESGDEGAADRLVDLYDEEMERWQSASRYGRLHRREEFLEYFGSLYDAMGRFFRSRNEPARAVRYWRDGADEALQAGLLDVYLAFRENEINDLLATGRFDEARLALEMLRGDITALLERDSVTELAASGNPYDAYYYLVLEGLTARLALQDDRPLDFARWQAAHALWQEMISRDARFAYLDHAGALSAGMANMLDLGHTNLQNVVMQMQEPNWQPRYELGVILSRSPDPVHRRSVAEILDGLERDFNVLMARRSGNPESLAIRAFREAARAEYRLYEARARFSASQGDYAAADTAVRAAFDAIDEVQRAYGARRSFVDRRRVLPGHVAALDGLEQDRAALDLLKAGIDEALGDYAAALKGYERFVAWSERSRDALPVNQRQHFFESVARDGYLGELRVAARIYLQRPNDAAMERVLLASEQFRSRQLREMLGTGDSTEASLAQVRAALGPGDAVLLFNDLESHLLTVAVDGRRHSLTLVERPRNWNRSLFDIRNELAERFYFDRGALARLVRPLFSGVEVLLGEADGLYVLSDGALSMLPASILPLPDGRLLQGDRPLTYLPSLALLGESRQGAPAPRALFALGDPVFNPDAVIDEHIGRELLVVTRAVSSLDALAPLPETRDEVEAIAGIFGDGDLLLGVQASRSVLRQTDLSVYRYLHFATHGVLGGEIPGLQEPALVLAYEQDEPNFLTASEVAGLSLNADMAVLSACNTGNGEYFRGEGLMGLGRAFMVAGTRQVLVSLWPVDSHATEQLMVAFYTGLGEGLDAASALARAQADLRRTPLPEGYSELRGLQRVSGDDANFDDYRNPFFWSPFILIGSG